MADEVELIEPEPDEFFPPSNVWTIMEMRAGLCSPDELGKRKPPLIHAKRLAQRATHVAIKALVDVATQSKDLNAKVKAANALLDRGYGRPEMTVGVNAPLGGQVDNPFPWVTAERIAAMKSIRATHVADDVKATELPLLPDPTKLN